MRRNGQFTVKKGLPREPKEEPVKSFSLVTEILGAPQRETVSVAGRVGRGRAAEQTSGRRKTAARAAQLVRTTVEAVEVTE